MSIDGRALESIIACCFNIEFLILVEIIIVPKNRRSIMTSILHIRQGEIIYKADGSRNFSRHKIPVRL